MQDRADGFVEVEGQRVGVAALPEVFGARFRTGRETAIEGHEDINVVAGALMRKPTGRTRPLAFSPALSPVTKVLSGKPGRDSQDQALGVLDADVSDVGRWTGTDGGQSVGHHVPQEKM
jgi:hypothetical protein